MPDRVFFHWCFVKVTLQSVLPKPREADQHGADASQNRNIFYFSVEEYFVYDPAHLLRTNHLVCQAAGELSGENPISPDNPLCRSR